MLFTNSRLQTTQKRLLHWEYKEINNSNKIILQHLWDDTYNFLNLLQNNNIKISHVLWKPNSVDENVRRNIAEKLHIPVDVIPYDQLDNSDFLFRLLWKYSEKELCVLEVWGYHLNALIKQKEDIIKNILWVVEITKFWHNRYLQYLNTHKKLPVPIVSIAESKIKEIEANYVAKMWVIWIDLLLHKYWTTIWSKKCWLLWYWMINSNVHSRLNQFWVKSCKAYDPKFNKSENPARKLFFSQKEILENSEVIIASTWSTSLSLELISLYCKDSVILAAMWSRWREFPIEEMKQKRTRREEDWGSVLTFKNEKWKYIHVLYNWIAMNYMLQSCPDEVMDPYFSEMLEWMKILHTEELSLNKIHTVDPEKSKEIISQRESSFL